MNARVARIMDQGTKLLQRSLLAVGPLDRLGRMLLSMAQFALVQIGVQVLGFVTGIIIVRCLDKQDYALFVVANTGMSALLALSNSGTNDAVVALSGRVWNDPVNLGAVIATALDFRRHLAALVLAPGLTFVGWLLMRNGATPDTLVLMLLIIAGAAYFQLSSSILVVVPRLRGEIRQLQSLDLIGALTRLFCVTSFAVSYFNPATALFAGGIAFAAQYVFLRRRGIRDVDLGVPPSPIIRTRIRSVVERQWLNEVNGVFQGQITLFLLSIIGSAQGVAEVGALGRIAVIFTVLGALQQSVILPRYSRCQNVSSLRQLYVTILVGSTVTVMLPVTLAVIWPRPFLWLLGPQYAHLASELVLVLISGAFGFIATTTWGLNAARAWIIPGWICVPIGLSIQCALLFVIGVSSVESVLWIGILSGIAAILINVVSTLLFSRCFSRLHVEQR